MIRKRLLAICATAIVVALCVIVYFTMTAKSSEENYYTGNQDGGGSLDIFDIRLPWMPSEEKNNTGGGGGGGSDESGGTSGSGEPDTESTENIAPRNNFTLSINSTHDLSVRVIFTDNGEPMEFITALPSSITVPEGTHICLAESTNSGTIRWLMDDENDCAFSECGGGLYDCDILMSRNLTITLRQYS